MLVVPLWFILFRLSAALTPGRNELRKNLSQRRPARRGRHTGNTDWKDRSRSFRFFRRLCEKTSVADLDQHYPSTFKNAPCHFSISAGVGPASREPPACPQWGGSASSSFESGRRDSILNALPDLLLAVFGCGGQRFAVPRQKEGLLQGGRRILRIRAFDADDVFIIGRRPELRTGRCFLI